MMIDDYQRAIEQIGPVIGIDRPDPLEGSRIDQPYQVGLRQLHAGAVDLHCLNAGQAKGVAWDSR